jgi:hypothetical protein
VLCDDRPAPEGIAIFEVGDELDEVATGLLEGGISNEIGAGPADGADGQKGGTEGQAHGVSHQRKTSTGLRLRSREKASAARNVTPVERSLWRGAQEWTKL